jgi:preprotein translocase subunit SecF
MFGSEFFDRSTSVLALVTVLLATLLLTARGLNFAVEFTGGMKIAVRYAEAPGSKSVQDTLVRAGFADASVKESSGYPSYYIVLPTRESDLTPELEQRVAKQVIAALGTEQRHVEVSSIEVVPQRVGRETLLLGAVPLTALVGGDGLSCYLDSWGRRSMCIAG